jgi:hypothetical protein
MEPKQIIQELEHFLTIQTSYSSETLKTRFDISPQDFIKYSEIDLSNNYDHNIINALSNSKRALDCQLDTLLVAFGYYDLSQKESWSFPKKLELISDLGVIAPRVLTKINKQRNLLEHQFIKPQKEQVEDFLDIAMLFIASTDKYSLKFISHITYSNDSSNTNFVLNNDYQNKMLVVYIQSNEKQKQKKAEKKTVKIKVNDPDYKTLFRIYLRTY